MVLNSVRSFHQYKFLLFIQKNACLKTNLDRIRDSASSIVNQSESTIERQRTVVLPVHLIGGSLSHLGDSS